MGLHPSSSYCCTRTSLSVTSNLNAFGSNIQSQASKLQVVYGASTCSLPGFKQCPLTCVLAPGHDLGSNLAHTPLQHLASILGQVLAQQQAMMPSLSGP
jgi:hypothetical protein